MMDIEKIRATASDPQLREGHRGTGQTSCQIELAHEGSLYLWCNGDLHYVRALALSLGRGDIQFVTPDFLNDRNNFVGKAWSELVIDHALRRLSPTDLEAIAEIEHYCERERRWRSRFTTPAPENRLSPRPIRKSPALGAGYEGSLKGYPPYDELRAPLRDWRTSPSIQDVVLEHYNMSNRQKVIDACGGVPGSLKLDVPADTEVVIAPGQVAGINDDRSDNVCYRLTWLTQVDLSDHELQVKARAGGWCPFSEDEFKARYEARQQMRGRLEDELASSQGVEEPQKPLDSHPAPERKLSPLPANALTRWSGGLSW